MADLKKKRGVSRGMWIGLGLLFVAAGIATVLTGDESSSALPGWVMGGAGVILIVMALLGYGSVRDIVRGTKTFEDK